MGTGNPTPVLNGPARPGDNRWTCSILAINPDTGQLAWGFQASPHDTHDWDAAEVPVLVDAHFGGAPRKMLLQASRNGYFFVLDRTNGKNLLTKPFAAVNWAKGVDEDGRPIPDPAKEPARDGRLVAPNEGGGDELPLAEFRSAYGPASLSARRMPTASISSSRSTARMGGRAPITASTARACFARSTTRPARSSWNHDIGGGGSAGVLTTETGLTFSGDAAGNVLALRTSDGATLWHATIGRVGNGPITYELDGRQYMVVAGGGVLYAWTLPEKVTTGPAR